MGGPPGEPGELIGRERELAQLGDLLAHHQVVTVTGRTGVGKSHLARAAVRAFQSSWQSAACLRCPGGPTAQERLARAADDALAGLRPHRRAPRTTGPRGSRGQALLLLDDVDAAHPECAGWVQRAVMQRPWLHVLVTSCQPLGLGAEGLLELAPLATEAPADGVPSPAAALFLSRAARLTGLRQDRTVLRAADDIGRAVEGLPLALELAAAKTRTHSAQQLAELVRHGQCWLSSPHPALRRHRSLARAIGAGYARCERQLRIVWSRASVFAGPFGQAAAELVCAGGGVAAHEVPGLLARLAAQGVLESDHDPHGPAQPRYRMPRAVREFGGLRLAEAGETEVALERRASHVRQVAQIAEHLWQHGCQGHAMQLLEEEQHDLKAMMRHAVQRPDLAQDALDAAGRLWFWWTKRQHTSEGLRHLLQLLSLHPLDRPESGTAQWLAAWLAARSDPDTAETLLRHLWPQALLAGDDLLIARISHVQGLVALFRGDTVKAAECFEHASECTPDRAPGGPGRAVYLAALAVARTVQDPAAAQRAARAALAQPELRDDQWSALRAHYARAFVDRQQGRTARAWNRARRALAQPGAAICAPNTYAALKDLLHAVESGETVPCATRVERAAAVLDRRPVPGISR
ncbi:ATP-binding protein [Streptomyces longispororuber]|uniref:ATP-binding protein n=1 Tax=Streptomyces longispororuber TaxID=68230 RepID=UPI0021089A74|nr:ATP-binding protein [Streptomyces longispororuber]MCQ4209675.1 ATP-binding protein [Streptomyces longispororuber]